MSTVYNSASIESTDTTEVTTLETGNVNYTSQETSTFTDTTVTTVTGFITEVTDTKTEPVIVTDVTIKGTTTTNHTTGVSSTSTSHDIVTDVTFYRSSQQNTDSTSTILRTTTINMETTTASDFSDNSSQVLFANTTSNSSVITGTSVDSGVEIHRLCDNCTTTVVVSCVSAGVVLLVLLMSALCFFRLRHKWRAKIQLERKKTDIWSMATYNNTIINENFADFQLAPPTNTEMRKSSGFSENSIQFYDPFTSDAPQTQFSSNQVVMRSNTLPPEEQFANSTLRRNTVSAPDELELSPQAFKGPDSLGFSDNRYTLRGRSSTFTVGRKQNVDRHVLLSHEELVEDQSAAENIGAVYKTPTSSYNMTEL
ncbi:uncharacterized protein LOC123527579 isoform X2 [Mercenaria mercenaria]|uniref:uncharacterized protein LOC123527579 isoform X2 n=1 Tax=Mercenaria mercenaria TaxID=6596 RepID=UPI00234EEA61|nr:uncharacterized protein LOC123527579 isoform X2 [Mercenaria mercenaria]